MYKLSTFVAESEYGLAAVPLFGPADSFFEKTASVNLLPEVLQYISNLKPKPGCQYVLVNAMGAGEYYGSNINGDHFEESGLIHTPPGWTGNPLVDRALGKNWTYGYPTFYNAYPYAHHRNKDPSRAYGQVELAVWNEGMKRVELVCRVDHGKCVKFGGVPVWDKLKLGQYPDVSMGSKVCYDLSSITTDWDLYQKAMKTFNPKKFAYPGLAVAKFHKELKAKDGMGIRGLSITRNDYDEWTKNHMNRILPDGRKVFVYNPYPRFFDISFVFIGADRTAKVMVFIVRKGDTRYVPSAEAGEKVACASNEILLTGQEKTASVSEDLLKKAFGFKGAEDKQGEIKKDVIPSQFAGKAVPLLTKSEKDLPESAIKALASVPEEKALGTTASMGIVLKPKEFQRITLIRMGKKDLSDELAAANKVFPKTEDSCPCSLGTSSFMPSLARLLMPLLQGRSGLGPFVEKRVIISEKGKDEPPTSHSSEDLRKIGAAYNGYRTALMEMVASAQDMLPKAAPADDGVAKLASAPADEVFTPLSFSYLSNAYLDEVPFADTAPGVVEPSTQSVASVKRGSPSETTWM
jgi:hypothetical protein